MNGKIASYTWIFFAISICTAFAGQMEQASVNNDSQNTWRYVNNGNMEKFWADLDGDGAPDIYFAMQGNLYSRILVDENGNGAADFISLLNQDGDYLLFHDKEGDGVFSRFTPKAFNDKDGNPIKFQKMILKGVRRKLFMDYLGEKWTQAETFSSVNGLGQNGGGKSLGINIRLTLTPSGKTSDPEFSLKPIVLPDKRFLLTCGKEETWAPKVFYLSDDLLEQGRANRKIELVLHGFCVRIESQSPKSLILIQVSGWIKIDNNSATPFTTILDLSLGKVSSETVILTDSLGNETGGLFVELFFSK